MSDRNSMPVPACAVGPRKRPRAPWLGLALLLAAAAATSLLGTPSALAQTYGSGGDGGLGFPEGGGSNNGGPGGVAPGGAGSKGADATAKGGAGGGGGGGASGGRVSGGASGSTHH